MNVDGKPYRTIWLNEDGWSVDIIDQTRLPHAFVVEQLTSVEQTAEAIRDMKVRGAPLIGATAAYGMALAIHADPTDGALERAHELLFATRPTAVNLRWALDGILARVCDLPPDERAAAAYEFAAWVCEDDVATCLGIGEAGLPLIEERFAAIGGGRPVNILTHCNAGWLATVDRGTATAPIYAAFDQGIPVHVWVDETRPRNQGASLTAWELGHHGVPHTVIVDNAGGHLMQQGLVDLCITGTDRTAANGDVCNKIGTYLKALAAHDNGVPFYVGLPHSTIDWEIQSGDAIPIEQRDGFEVSHMTGATPDGRETTIALTPAESPVANYAFDVTPARLITALLTERGACAASREGLLSLYPERA